MYLEIIISNSLLANPIHYADQLESLRQLEEDVSGDRRVWGGLCNLLGQLPLLLASDITELHLTNSDMPHGPKDQREGLRVGEELQHWRCGGGV